MQKYIIGVLVIILLGAGYLYWIGNPVGGTSERGDEVIETLSSYLQLSADFTTQSSGEAIKNGSGIVRGIFVSTVPTNGEFEIWDSGTSTGKTGGTRLIFGFTPTSGTMYDFGSGVQFSAGLWAVVSSGTQATFIYR